MSHSSGDGRPQGLPWSTPPHAETSDRRLTIELVAASFVVLMLELTLIRWIPSQVRVVAYYPNLVLISTFLGLGVGCLLARQRTWTLSWPVWTLAIVVVAWGMSGIIFTQNPVSEHLFLLYLDLPADAPIVHGIWEPTLLFFLMCTVTFVPLGQFVAERLDEFRRRGHPLRGYSRDLTGSLLGVVAFAVLGFAGTFPVVWFAAVLIPGTLLVSRRLRWRAAYLAVAAVTLVVVHAADKADQYSPYYAVSTIERPRGGYEIMVNGSLHQMALPLAGDDSRDAYVRRVRPGYVKPYQLLGRPPGRVLVLGAGTGNDVAVALAMGADHVDAVEIDPVILRYGRELHPSRPYDSPRVRVVNTDARAFLNTSDERYDVVVLGTLDSMTQLSALSGVRLDNFVYTRDSFRAIGRHLTDRGVLVVYSMVGTDYIDKRLNGLAAEACGEVPIQERRLYLLFNRIYMCGPGFGHVDSDERRADVSQLLRTFDEGIELPTDDWPYFYLARRSIPPFYWGLALAFGLVAMGGVGAASPQMRRALGGRASFDWPMFWLGAGFLLIETRAATEMNLVWSATWLTSAVVFGSILATVLAATLLAAVRPVRYEWATLGVAMALLATWATPTAALLGTDPSVKLLFSVAFVGIPAFFASLCFVALFRREPDAGIAFGWNLLGAVAGGLLELGTMVLGFKALHLVALGAYVLAFLAWRRARPLPAVAPDPPEQRA